VPSNPKRGWHDVKNGIKGVILFIGGGLVFVSGWILGFVLVTASDFLVRRNHPELWPAPPAAPPTALTVDTLRVRVLELDSLTIGGRPAVLFGYREGSRRSR